MKKYSWIVALLLALSLAFLGCPSEPKDKDEKPDTGDLEWKTVWEMAVDENIQALPEGKLSFGTKVADPQPIKPLVRAGNEDAHVTVSAVKVDGKVSLEFTTGDNWGAGLDLLSSAFSFQEDDKITLKGEVLTIGTGGSKPQFQANGKIGGEYTLSKSDGEKASTVELAAFDWEITLDATAIANIKTGESEGSPWPGIRLSGNGTGTKVRIDNIKIEGNRPSTLKTLAAPVIELTATGVSWAAVEGAGGYKVFLDGAEEATVVLGAGATSVNLKTNKAVADGDHKVKVGATGEANVSKDSPLSNEVTYTKVTPPGGSVFSLADWLADEDDGELTGNLTDPLIKSGSPTITKSATGLAITGRTNDYFGVDINIGATGLDLDLDNNVYIIVVTGTGEAADVAKIGQTGSPYGEFKRSEVSTSGEYTIIGTVSASNNAAKTNIRIQTATANKDFTISNIEIFSGAVFDLTEWLADEDDGELTGNLTDPLIKSGSPTITKSATGLAITGRTNDYFGVDVNIGATGLDLDLDTNIYKIVVTGTGEAADVAKIGQTGSPYGEFKRSEVSTAGNYTIIGTVSATNNAAKTNIRIQTATANKDFTISNILIWVE